MIKLLPFFMLFAIACATTTGPDLPTCEAVDARIRVSLKPLTPLDMVSGPLSTAHVFMNTDTMVAQAVVVADVEVPDPKTLEVPEVGLTPSEYLGACQQKESSKIRYVYLINWHAPI